MDHLEGAKNLLYLANYSEASHKYDQVVGAMCTIAERTVHHVPYDLGQFIKDTRLDDFVHSLSVSFPAGQETHIYRLFLGFLKEGSSMHDSIARLRHEHHISCRAIQRLLRKWVHYKTDRVARADGSRLTQLATAGSRAQQVPDCYFQDPIAVEDTRDIDFDQEARDFEEEVGRAVPDRDLQDPRLLHDMHQYDMRQHARRTHIAAICRPHP